MATLTPAHKPARPQIQYPAASEYARTVKGGSLILGIVIMIGGLNPNWDPSLALAGLPDAVDFWLGLTLALGSGLSLAGIYTAMRGEWLSEAWRLERAGLKLSIGAWMAFAGITLAYRPIAAMAAWIVYLTLAVAGVRRHMAVNRYRRNTTRNVEEPHD